MYVICKVYFNGMKALTIQRQLILFNLYVLWTCFSGNSLSSCTFKDNKVFDFCVIIFSRYILVQINNGNTRTVCKIYSKLTIKTSERRQWRRSGKQYWHRKTIKTAIFHFSHGRLFQTIQLSNTKLSYSH